MSYYKQVSPKNEHPPKGENVFIVTIHESEAIGYYHVPEYWIRGFGYMRPEDILYWLKKID